ncbi:MAG: dihydropteroate synthase [Magnetococcales bacterium]|nr:dihydropteroate synthase [Magnetococcales bacterium]
MDHLETTPQAEHLPLLRETLAHHLATDAPLSWTTTGRTWHLAGDRPLIMGVVNCTPDSFSDGGSFHEVAAAVAHGLALARAGADILDVGGESTRPGATPVSQEEELRRVIPVIQGLAQRLPIAISVDTSKAAVMAAALEAGASLVNDVTALRGDPQAAALLAPLSVPVILMHMAGSPQTMQQEPRYWNPVVEIYAFLKERVDWCLANGFGRERLWLDPGIGFGKERQHNLGLLRHLRLFRGLGAPLLVGVSRKRIVGELTGIPEPSRRDVGSMVLGAMCVLEGARILRVHEVEGVQQALHVVKGWMNF